MTDGDAKSSDGIWERELVTKLATAALKEQRRARLWGIFFKLLTFAYITLILLMAVDWRRDGVTGKKHTAMVEVNGLIAPGSDASAERIPKRVCGHAHHYSASPASPSCGNG